MVSGFTGEGEKGRAGERVFEYWGIRGLVSGRVVCGIGQLALLLWQEKVIPDLNLGEFYLSLTKIYSPYKLLCNFNARLFLYCCC